MITTPPFYSWKCDWKFRVDIGRSRNNNKVRSAVGALGIQRCSQIQLLLSQILFNILILNRWLPAVDQFHFFWYNIYSIHFMVLRQQCGNTQAHLAGASNCNRVILHHSSPCLSQQKRDRFPFLIIYVNRCGYHREFSITPSWFLYPYIWAMRTGRQLPPECNRRGMKYGIRLPQSDGPGLWICAHFIFYIFL